MKTIRIFIKALSIALLITLSFLLFSCNLLKGALKLESFTVDRSTVKTMYFVGETIDFSTIRAYVKYSDESLNTTYTANDLEIFYPDDITATAGNKQVTVFFMDPHLNSKQETSVPITVNEDPNAIKHDRYVVDASGMKKDYTVGENISFEGVRIIEKFTGGGADVEMSDLSTLVFDYDPNIITTHGVYTIGVKYNGEDAGTITVTVTDPTLDLIPISSIEVTGEYKSNYEVGDEIDFVGLTVTVTYENGTVDVIDSKNLTFSEISTDTIGVKNVIISFVDPINRTDASIPLSVTVIEAKALVVQFEKNSDFTAFDTNNKTAGKTEYGASGFSGEFLLGNRLYVIGDDNAFRMLPSFSVMDKSGNITSPEAFYSTVDIYVMINEEYVLLNKKTGASAVEYVYTLDGATVATVDTYNGVYHFSHPLDGVKISVLPSNDHYKGTEDLKPVVLEAKVIDAYNVYEAWQLAVIDNDPARTDWDTLKTEHGIKNLSVAGIVLHKDITILADDAPESLFDKSTRDVVYRNSVTGEEKVYPAGTYYFKDKTALYSRHGSEDFIIEGNLFNISLKSFPVAPSNGVFPSSLGLGYGSDFSNCVLFQFEAQDSNWLQKPASVPKITIQNISLIGNASQDFWQEESDNGLLTAGGLILVKSSRHAEVTISNTLSNSFYITYFPDFQGVMTVSNSKCYDSYQNAAFVWGSELTVKDSFINGAGGPLVISISASNDENIEFPSRTVINNTVAEGHVTGEEIWFTTVNAGTTVANIKALGSALHYKAALGNFVNSDGKMNILGVIMSDSMSPDAAATEFEIQGSLGINGFGIDRWHDDDFWSTIYNHPAFRQKAPFLSVEDKNGIIHTVYYNGTTFADLKNKELGTDASHSEISDAFKNADRIILSQGGLTVIFEFYHY